jgi:AraC-like DNA-binding protein
MAMKKAYRPDEVAALFNISVGHVYRLVKWGCFRLTAPGKISGISIRKFMRKQIPGCSLPVYPCAYIAAKYNVSPKTLQRLLKNGSIPFLRMNPHSKSNKGIRVPDLTPEIVKRLPTGRTSRREKFFLKGTMPLLMRKKDLARRLGMSFYRVNVLCADGVFIQPRRINQVRMDSVLRYLKSQGHSDDEIKKLLGFERLHDFLYILD